jgi:hypothetical protein
VCADRAQLRPHRLGDVEGGQAAVGVLHGGAVLPGVLERLGEAEQQQALGARVQPGPESRLAEVVGLLEAAGGGEQPDGVGDERGAAGVVLTDHVQGVHDEVGGGAGRGGRDLQGGLVQDRDGLAAAGAARLEQVLGDLDGGAALGAGDDGGLPVQHHGDGVAEGAVHGEADEVVHEGEAVLVVDEHPRGCRLLDLLEQRRRAHVQQLRHRLDADGPAEHRRGLQ